MHSSLSTWSYGLALLATTLGAGCSDDTSSTASGPGVVVTPGPAKDAGSSRRGTGLGPGLPDAGGDEFDGGVAPPAANNCQNIEESALDPIDGLPQTGATTPTDFSVSVVEARFVGACVDPVLEIRLSEGVCPDGNGHELVFEIRAEDIVDGKISKGLNLIVPESVDDKIIVRYRRPVSRSTNGEWGNCNGSQGEMEFFEAPNITDDAPLQARFGMTLSACDGSTSGEQRVEGEIGMMLMQSLAEACP